MIGKLGRHAIDLIVVLFAVLGFAFVPLGRQTALEHVVAIFSTRAATDTGHEMVEAAQRLKQRLLDKLRADTLPSAEPPASAAPAHRPPRAAAWALRSDPPDAGLPDASLTSLP